MASVDYRLNPNGVLNTVAGAGTPVNLMFGDLATAGVSDFVTHNSVTLPDGNYEITFVAAWPYHASGIRGVYIKQNGNMVAEDEKDPDNVAPQQTLSALVQGGGTFTFSAYQNCGSTLNFVGSFVNIQAV